MQDLDIKRYFIKNLNYEFNSFLGVEDKISIMSSLVRPKKITFRGSDGKLYSFLAKPKEINKIFKISKYKYSLKDLCSFFLEND